jgi:hypothetical protein
MVQKIPASGLESAGGSFKNVIINGDMVISQRATGTTTISGTAHNTLDRFAGMESTDGTATLEQHSMSVADQATTGQRYAALWKCSGTDSSIGATQYAGLQYFAEAQHLQHFLYGTSAAKDLTLSFWVKSNTTGTYSIGIYKPDNTGYYHPTTYAISSADTWEKKVIHISPTAGSTSLITSSGGAIANDNGLGIAFYFYTALGSNYHTSSINTWSTTADFGTSDQPNLMSSTDNNWYITGVQLEIGDTASDFEHIPHDVQLQRCKRYYEKIQYEGQVATMAATSTSAAYARIESEVEKRADPSVTLPTTGQSTNQISVLSGAGSYPSTTGSHAVGNPTPLGFRLQASSYDSLETGGGLMLYVNGTVNIEFDAEL